MLLYVQCTEIFVGVGLVGKIQLHQTLEPMERSLKERLVKVALPMNKVTLQIVLISTTQILQVLVLCLAVLMLAIR